MTASHIALVLSVLVLAGCPTGTAQPTSLPANSASPPTNSTTTPPTKQPTSAQPSTPTPVPPHLKDVRRKLELGHVGLAMKLADGLLEAYPDDPWVLADVGYAQQALQRGHAEGELLPRALELAEDPSLRAQVLLYQARLTQLRDGLPAGRALLERSLVEFELAASRRNLEIIDAYMPGALPPAAASPHVERICERLIAEKHSKREFKTCVGAQVGVTTWVRETTVFDDMVSNLRVFHRWHLASPAPTNPEGFQVDLGGEVEDIVHHYSPCSSAELVTLGGSSGARGAFKRPNSSIARVKNMSRCGARRSATSMPGMVI